MKKTSILFVLLVFAVIYTHCQPGTWQWSIRSVAAIFPHTCFSADGSTYQTGDIACMPYLGNDTLPADPALRFIARFDANGNVVWVKTFHLGPQVLGTRIATDNKGNVFIYGGFTDSIAFFGADTLYLTGISNEFNTNNYLVKYDSMGNVLWARTSSSTNQSITSTDVASDLDGNVYVSGYSADYGVKSFIFGNDTINGDCYVAKYDGFGTLKWAQAGHVKAGTTGLISGGSLSADYNGNIYFSAVYDNAAPVFGGDTAAANPTLLNALSLVKYDSAGNVHWVKSFGLVQEGAIVVTDNEANFYLLGTGVDTTVIIGADTLNLGDALNNSFVAKFNPAGNLMWAKGFSSSNNAVGFAITTDPNRNVYIGGAFGGFMAIFDKDTVIGYDTIPRNLATPVIIKVDTAGNTIWAQTIKVTPGKFASGGNFTDMGTDVSGNIYVALVSNDSVTIIGSDTFSASVCRQNNYIAKLGQCTQPEPPAAHLIADTICAGTSTTLVATGSGTLSWFDTSFGGNNLAAGDTFTTPLLNSTVEFYVQDSTSCGTSSRLAINVFVTIPPTIQAGATPDSICSGSVSTLLAAGSGGTISWYNAATGGTWLSGSITFTTPLLDSTTTYYAQDSNGCASLRQPVTVVVKQASVPIISQPLPDSLSTAVFANYQWLLNDSVIEEASGQGYLPAQSGSYRVVVINSAGCSDTSAVYNFILNGIAANEWQPNIKLYPNPNTGSFVLETQHAIDQSFIIYDMLGNEVLQQIITADKQIIKLNRNATGVYYLSLKDEGVNYTLKVVVAGE